MKQFFNVLGQLFGFLTILLFAFIFANELFGFGVSADIINILETVKVYAVFGVCGLAGFEMVAGKKFFAFLYFIILAFVVIMSFFPSVGNLIISYVTTFIA